jgi:ribosomal protein S4E
MTRDHVINAIEEGIPFQINMADGKSYLVSDKYRVSLGKTTVVVVDEKDCPHLLPLLTMTGISYVNGKHS